MKAILEIELPENCLKCKLVQRYFGGSCPPVCTVTGTGFGVSEYPDRRAPFCPLKIVPEVEAPDVSEPKPETPKVEYTPVPPTPEILTLRDYFAAAALTGLLADPETAGTSQSFVNEAYHYADALLAARESSND